MKKFKEFNTLFNDILRTQLILKGVIAEDDWSTVKENVTYGYMRDGHYAEMRDMDLLRDRMDMLNTMEPFIGGWFSKQYVQKQVFRMSDEEIDSMQKEMDAEPEPEGEEEY